MRLLHPAPGVEFTHDPSFEARLRRLSVVSLVALGVITVLAIRDDAPIGVVLALVAGWVTMPTLLRLSLNRPALRYALTVPATLVSLGLLAFCIGGLPGGTAAAGWWLITGAVGLGALMGSWLWFRLIPVPEPLDDPFSPARLVLVGLHVAAALIGIGLVAWY